MNLRKDQAGPRLSCSSLGSGSGGSTRSDFSGSFGSGAGFSVSSSFGSACCLSSSLCFGSPCRPRLRLSSLRRKKQPSSLFRSAVGRRLCSTMRFAILFSQLLSGTLRYRPLASSSSAARSFLCSYHYVDHDGDGACHQVRHPTSEGKWSPGTCDDIVLARASPYRATFSSSAGVRQLARQRGLARGKQANRLRL